MSFSGYLEAELLDHVFGGADYSRPATLYIAASTADPLDDASGLAEPSGNGYSRASVTNNATNFPAATGSSPATKSNGTEIAFPQASGSWGTITHLAIMDAASGGNMIARAALTASRAVGNLDTLTIAAGELDITLD